MLTLQHLLPAIKTNSIVRSMMMVVMINDDNDNNNGDDGLISNIIFIYLLKSKHYSAYTHIHHANKITLHFTFLMAQQITLVTKAKQRNFNQDKIWYQTFRQMVKSNKVSLYICILMPRLFITNTNIHGYKYLCR